MLKRCLFGNFIPEKIRLFEENSIEKDVVFFFLEEALGGIYTYQSVGMIDNRLLVRSLIFM